MILIQDYSRTEILISNLWVDWYVPKFTIEMEVSEPYLTIYWFKGEFDTKVQKRVIDYRDVSGYGYANPTSAADLKSIIDGYIESAWTDIGPGGDLLTNAGDLLTHDGASDVILPVGTNEYILQVNTALSKKLNWVGVNTIVSGTSIGAAIYSSSDATPNNSDYVATADSGILKKITWTNVKAFLKTYFDTIYQSAGSYLSNTLASENIFVGNGSNVATAVAMSGDATLNNAGAITITNDAITYAKMQDVSATDRVLGRYTSGAGNVEELTYTQLREKLGLQLSLAVYTTNTTISVLPSAERFFGNSNRYIFKIDLANYTYVRLTFRVTTASTAGAAPRFRAKYSNTFTTTIGSFSDIGTSEVSGTLAATGISDSGWIALATGAKINDCFVTVGELGGDGTGNPVISSVYIYFK